MTLTAGDILAHYRISAAIGVGGMGEVYRATDTKLGREVAIKVLPVELARDADRLARFEREAKLLASLNHPNIAHVYGFESATLDGGVPAHFLAMELVEGEDLAERLRRGAIPVDESLLIAKQIAEALEEAHDRGIVHRDLKPANVKVTLDGKVKVLDFGLAKAFAGDSAIGSGADLSQSPTLAHTGTQAGVILGTAAYMSPEQARGRPVDKRTDIWAFGVVLYEMLTGRRLFEGETVTDVLAAVVRQEIDWSALPTETSGGVRRVLARCLQRDPRKRLRDIGDAQLDLEEADPPVDQAESSQTSRGAPAERSLVRRLGGAAALILLGVVAGALVVGQLDRAPAPRAVHFATSVALYEDLLQRGSGVVLSLDGTQIVFRGEQDGRQGLYIRSLDHLGARLIPGTEDGTAPFFSPDGAWMAFFSAGPDARGAELMKTRIEGGAPIRVAEAASSALAGFTASGSWSESGEIVFSGSSSVIQRVSALGGQVTAATELDASRGERQHVQPVWLPGGRSFLYVADVGGRQDVMVASGDAGEGRVLIVGGTSPRYAAPGYLLFVREKTLLAAAFDLRSLQVTGEPSAVVEALDVAAYGSYRTARFDLSPNGTLAYLADRPVGRSGQLVLVDRRGNTTPAFEETGTYLAPRLSPDETRVAYAAVDEQSGQRDVWIGDLKRGTRTRLTLATGASTDPIWTPDGQGVTYASTRDLSLALFTSPADGSREPTQLSRGVDPGGGGRFLLPGAWLRDGSGLVFHAIETSNDIGILRTDSGEEEMLLAGPFAELEPSLSPDDRFMAYVSNESGRREVYVRSLDGAAGRVQVSSEGGDEPVWSPQGGEIFYRQGPRMIAVPVSTTSSSVTLGTPAVLFEGRYDVDPYNNDATNYDVTRDGQRFLMVRPVGDPADSRQQLNVVVNWYEELARRRGGPR
jgi:eukaryotic-like serine/threonine-protein kinase